MIDNSLSFVDVPIDYKKESITNCVNCGAPLNKRKYCEYCATNYGSELDVQPLKIYAPSDVVSVKVSITDESRRIYKDKINEIIEKEVCRLLAQELYKYITVRESYNAKGCYTNYIGYIRFIKPYNNYMEERNNDTNFIGNIRFDKPYINYKEEK